MEIQAFFHHVIELSKKANSGIVPDEINLSPFANAALFTKDEGQTVLLVPTDRPDLCPVRVVHAVPIDKIRFRCGRVWTEIAGPVE